MATFKNLVMDGTTQNPTNLAVSLSAPSNSVILTGLDSYNGLDVVGVLFDDIAGEFSTPLVDITVSGVTLQVSPDYDGATFALYSGDRKYATFVVDAGTNTQTITSDWQIGVSGPEERRKRLLEYI